MKRFLSLAATAMFLFSGVVVAEELKSGLQKGESIGAFNVTKCAGAEKDGTPIGKKLCYRCKNGSAPQVIIFTRSADEKVAQLVQKLDEQVQKHEEAQLRAFVNMLGESQSTATESVKKLAKQTKAKNIPFVVPNEHENGPENYGLNPKAEVTVILANEGTVEASHAFQSADKLDVDAVLSDIEKLVN